MAEKMDERQVIGYDAGLEDKMCALKCLLAFEDLKPESVEACEKKLERLRNQIITQITELVNVQPDETKLRETIAELCAKKSFTMVLVGGEKKKVIETSLILQAMKEEE